MDPKVGAFLKEHGVTEAAEYLAGINYESFRMLQREHSKELITNINARIKFDSIFFRWINADASSIEPVASSDVLNSENQEKDETCERRHKQTDSDVDVHQQQATIEERPEQSENENQEVHHEEASKGVGEFEVVEHVDAFNIMGNRDLDYFIIVEKYKRQDFLSPGDRITLAHSVLKHILQEDVTRELTTAEFEDIATTISIIFPSESSQTFYIRGQRKAPARGKLFQSYKAFREQLSAAGMITRRKRKHQPSSVEEEADEQDVELNNPNESETVVTENFIQFSKSHTDPWPDVVSKWIKSYEERDIILNENSVEMYISQFPCLGMANGYELLQADFRRKYPETKASISRDKFISQCIKLGATSTDTTAKSILRASSKSRSESDEMILALRLIPFLLPLPKSKVTAANPRLNKSEISKRFVNYFSTLADDDEQQTEFISLKVVGSGKHIAYIGMGNFKYPFESIFDAVTCCFELFFALSVKYPRGTNNIWDFINIAFYNIDTQTIAPSVHSLLSDFNSNV